MACSHEFYIDKVVKRVGIARNLFFFFSSASQVDLQRHCIESCWSRLYTRVPARFFSQLEVSLADVYIYFSTDACGCCFMDSATSGPHKQTFLFFSLIFFFHSFIHSFIIIYRHTDRAWCFQFCSAIPVCTCRGGGGGKIL